MTHLGIDCDLAEGKVVVVDGSVNNSSSLNYRFSRGVPSLLCIYWSVITELPIWWTSAIIELLIQCWSVERNILYRRKLSWVWG